MFIDSDLYRGVRKIVPHEPGTSRAYGELEAGRPSACAVTAVFFIVGILYPPLIVFLLCLRANV